MVCSSKPWNTDFPSCQSATSLERCPGVEVMAQKRGGTLVHSEMAALWVNTD